MARQALSKWHMQAHTACRFDDGFACGLAPQRDNITFAFYFAMPKTERPSPTECVAIPPFFIVTRVKQPWDLARIARMSATLLLFGAAGWTIWHFAQKRISDEKTSTDSSRSSSKQQEIQPGAPQTQPPIKPLAKVKNQAPDKGIPINPQAVLQFSFFTPDPNKFPILETDAPLIDGVVTVEITALNKGTVPAKNGWMIVTICNDCRYAEEPQIWSQQRMRRWQR
jgi:hypothetical protein